MITSRQKPGRAQSARLLIFLGACAGLVLVGPNGTSQSMFPGVSFANAAETTTQGWIGVQIQPVTADMAEGLGMKEGKGALVANPLKDSPAEKAGILAGDVITALNDNTVKDARDFANQIRGMVPGATAKLTIWRKDAEKSISMTIGEMPKQQQAAQATAPTPEADAKITGADTPKLGLMLASAEHVAGGGSEGVVVVDIARNGLAFEHGLKTGDVILDVAGKKVGTPGDVREAVRNAHKGGKRVVLMRLKSDETTKFIAIPIARS